MRSKSARHRLTMLGRRLRGKNADSLSLHGWALPEDLGEFLTRLSSQSPRRSLNQHGLWDSSSHRDEECDGRQVNCNSVRFVSHHGMELLRAFLTTATSTMGSGSFRRQQSSSATVRIATARAFVTAGEDCRLGAVFRPSAIAWSLLEGCRSEY
jgi:hypothetical protein